MSRIVDIQMKRLAQLLEDRKIAVKLEPTARDWLAEKGWDPAYGARPLKRVIQKSVQDPLAELILSGRIKDGEKVAITRQQAGAQVQRRGLLRRRNGSFVDALPHVFDEITGLRLWAGPKSTSGLRPPELSTLIGSQIKPRVWVTSAMCDIGRCSSVRRHGVSQNCTTLFDTPT